MGQSQGSGAKPLFWIGFTLLLIGFGPLISGMIAMELIAAYDCEINESFARTCMIAGTDWSETLQMMVTGIWFMFFTFLLIPLGGIVWLVALIRWLKGRRNAG